MPPLVRIHDIGLYLRCPRLIYFENLDSMPMKIDAKNAILRSLMLSISQKDDLEGHLRDILLRLEQEVPLIYDLETEEVEIACQQLQNEIPSISQGLAGQLDLLIPCEVEIDLHSDRLGLTGRLDRLTARGMPALIRTGRAPQDGIWKKDRLMLAGYAMLLAEAGRREAHGRDAKEGTETGGLDKGLENELENGSENGFGKGWEKGLKKESELKGRCINFGLVEYPRQGLVRSAQIRSVDRARVLRIRDRIRLIKEGQLPDRPENAPCEKCHAAPICETRHSLASRFF